MDHLSSSGCCGQEARGRIGFPLSAHTAIVRWISLLPVPTICLYTLRRRRVDLQFWSICVPTMSPNSEREQGAHEIWFGGILRRTSGLECTRGGRCCVHFTRPG